MKKSRLLGAVCALLSFLILSTSAGASTINFDTLPTDTIYIDSGLLLGSSGGGYAIGGCGVGEVGCLGDSGAFVGELTFIFVDLGTTDQASTDMVEFILCRDCSFRGSSAQVFDPIGDLLATIDMNTAAGVANRTFSYSAASIGSVVVDLGSGSDAVESITFGNVSAVPVPAALWLFSSGLLGFINVARRKKAS